MLFQSLCSGSKGNCYVLSTKKVNILIDMGLPLSILEQDLESLKIRPNKIDGVFITHEHNDHILGLDAFSKKYIKPVFVHEKGFVELAKKLYWTNHVITKFTDGPFDFKGIKVDTIRCSHDSAYCCGFKFTDGTTSIATITDLGYATDDLIGFVDGCQLVLLESNHDVEMLKYGDYPPLLKRRIGGRKGHLSNDQTAKLAVQMANVGVKHLLLGHLSLNNNTPEMAFYTVVEELKKHDIVEGKDISVDVVTQYNKSEVFYIE